LPHGLSGPRGRESLRGGGSRRSSVRASICVMSRDGVKRTSGSSSKLTKLRIHGWPHAVHLSPFWLSSGLIVWHRKHEGCSSSASLGGRARIESANKSTGSNHAGGTLNVLIYCLSYCLQPCFSFT